MLFDKLPVDLRKYVLAYTRTSNLVDCEETASFNTGKILIEIFKNCNLLIFIDLNCTPENKRKENDVQFNKFFGT